MALAVTRCVVLTQWWARWRAIDKVPHTFAQQGSRIGILLIY